MYKAILLLLVVVSVASAFVCRPNICETVDCRQTTSCPPGETLKKNGGFCGCCDVCVTVLKEGDGCGPRPRGVPPTSECGEGLICNPQTNTCQQQ